MVEKTESIVQDLNKSIEKALEWSRDNQAPEGYWIGGADSNCCMEAEWIIAMYFLGLEDDPKMPRVIQAILNEQRSDGSWEIYYKAPTGDINTTVECYAALRVAGFDKDHEALVKARKWIFKNGGLRNIRVFTKYWLALIGEWPWEHTSNLPPEIIFLPKWFPLNIYDFASWARATIVPLAILCSNRPCRPLPPEKRLDELFPEGRDAFDFSMPSKAKLFSLERLFILVDRLLNKYVNFPIKPLRKTAKKYCLDWIIKHQDADGVWGGIQPPFIYSLMALHTEGYYLDHPILAAGLRAFDEHWSREKNGAIYINATESIVWDTVLTMLAFLDCGEDPNKSEPLQKALRWLLDKFVDRPGDWQVKVKGVEPGAWAFERANTWYPDVDDTALVLIVLQRLLESFPKTAEIDFKMTRATNWTVAMQSKNGGWAAFDKDNTSLVVTKVPFCDFGEALDPPSADVTAHVLEALGLMGWPRSNPVVQRGLDYLLKEQEEDGSWFGRWGVNYIYGTCAALCALKALGMDSSEEVIQRAAKWIVEHQNSDGGWGESCASYMDDSYRGKGPSTASQTSWAIMALLSVQDSRFDQAILKGLRFLVSTQKENGTWDEPWYTGTGFPGYGVGDRIDLSQWADKLEQGAELSRGFMVNYNLYRHYFPLIAMGRARRYFAALQGGSS
ncbi:MAG: squalene--hopene cyclase [Thermodesulfobacteria bacterium]|nr:squalene--hopene cyclase [Thermodesulfobacteriota bacterium]